jgi:hypothetical protein
MAFNASVTGTVRMSIQSEEQRQDAMSWFENLKTATNSCGGGADKGKADRLCQ